MRKIVSGLSISLDGVIEDADQWMGPWFNPQLGQAIGSMIAAQDAMLMGRTTYQYFAPRLFVAVRAVPGADQPDAQVRLFVHLDGGGLDQHHDHRGRSRGRRAGG